MKHLAMAVLYDPSNALARGLMGLVAYQGKWERPDEVSRQAQDDPRRKALLQEYLRRRASTPETADGHWKLANWCEQNGLKNQAAAHFQRVIRLDPRRDVAWRHLGFKKQGNHWVKPELVAAAKARAQEQQRADRHWKPILERYRSSLQSRDPSRRGNAEQALAQITDRDAVPMVWATFGRGDAASQKVAVQVLGQIDDASASRSLVLLAVFGGTADARSQAIATLRGPDARAFAAMLIGMILAPIEYEVKKVRGPGQGGELLIKGQGSAPNVKRLYSPPAGPTITPQPGDRMSISTRTACPSSSGPRMSGTGRPRSSTSRAVPQQPMPTAQQKGQFMNMVAHSGLGAQGQRIGQTMIKATMTTPSSHQSEMPILSQNPFDPDGRVDDAGPDGLADQLRTRLSRFTIAHVARPSRWVGWRRWPRRRPSRPSSSSRTTSRPSSNTTRA